MINAGQSTSSLYSRLGCRDGITRFVGCLYERLLADSRINWFWRGHSNDTQAKEIRSVIDLICQATGGPAAYQGRDMHTSHEGLHIVEADWTVFSELATTALVECGVSGKERAEVLSYFDSYKDILSDKERTIGGLDKAEGAIGRLTRREKEVLRLVAVGQNNPEIAHGLSISVNTVTRHLTNIFTKTGCSNRVEAALYAARLGLVQ